MKKFKSLFWFGFIIVGSPIIIIFGMFIMSKIVSDKQSKEMEMKKPLYDTIEVKKTVIVYDTVKVEKIVNVKPKKIVVDTNSVRQDTIK